MNAVLGGLERIPNAGLFAPGVRWKADLLAILLGVGMTLCVRGYRFGEGNHTVYLLDGLRKAHPELLQNDWFSTQTLQYHGVFSWMVAGLIRLNVLESVFLIGYLALAVGLHWGWMGLARSLRVGRQGYLLSVFLFYLSAGGLGLGAYHFLQDSSFLPSNVANVAMLWGIWKWIDGRYMSGGVWLGVAGLFHLNHAVAAGFVWGALSVWRFIDERRSPKSWQWIWGTVWVAGLCALNVVPVLPQVLARREGMQLDEFVRLYVKFRHPHHYDPWSWPVGLWTLFLWAIPLAGWIWWNRRQDDRVQEAGRVFLIYGVVLVAALLGAGVWYVSESLVQMSLWRFSIYPKLLSCIGAASVIRRLVHERWIRWGIAGAAGLVLLSHHWVPPEAEPFIDENRQVILIMLAVAFIAMSRMTFAVWRGSLALAATVLMGAGVLALLVSREGDGVDIGVNQGDDADYLAVCDWVRENTPVDAVFLVPPWEESFRWRAQRAIVVNFKGVPQLSGELVEWKRRLEGVLGAPLHHFDHAAKGPEEWMTGHWMRQGAGLWDMARANNASYIVVPTWPWLPQGEVAFQLRGWRVYEVNPGR